MNTPLYLISGKITYGKEQEIEKTHNFFILKGKAVIEHVDKNLWKIEPKESGVMVLEIEILKGEISSVNIYEYKREKWAKKEIYYNGHELIVKS